MNYCEYIFPSSLLTTSRYKLSFLINPVICRSLTGPDLNRLMTHPSDDRLEGP